MCDRVGNIVGKGENADYQTLRERLSENIVGKGENALLLFQQCFLPFPRQISSFLSLLFCRLQMLSIWTGVRFCHLVMG